MSRWFMLGCLASLLSLDLADASEAVAPRKIVLIAGKKSHGPVGNGIHDYGWSVKLLRAMLENSNIRDKVRVEHYLDGWPANSATLEDAAAILIVSDGRDGNLYEEAPHLASPDRVRYVDGLMKKGCGFLTFHFSTFAPNRYSAEILRWSGGFFQWEQQGKRDWYSAIQTKEAEVRLPSGDHPICRGLSPFTLRDEFYFNLRFPAEDSRWKAILQVPALGGRAPDGNVVAWARDREDGGRGFGTTCGHFYDNWKQAPFRKMMLNALAWSARVEVPVGGVEAPFFTHQQIEDALNRNKARVLLIAGNEAHKWHNWEKTTPRLKAILEKDPRLVVDVSTNFDDLGKKDLSSYRAILLNWCNWQDPRGADEASKKAFARFVHDGGGLILVHFANGAFHFSLPKAGESDWPEYRKMVRRVWNHQRRGTRPASSHDAFGKFQVRIAKPDHPLTSGLTSFEVEDELYFDQDGEDPVEPLITAESRVTKRLEPLAWTYNYGKGKVFQTLLGHSEKTYDAPQVGEMLRRAAIWSTGLPAK